MKTAIVLAFLAIPAAAFAQVKDSPRNNAALDRLQSEMTVCLAYYSFAKNCLEANDPSVKQMDGTIDQLTGRSYSIGKSIGMTGDAMLARLKSVMDEHSAVTGDSCDNVAKLHQAHAARCKLVVENPHAIFSEFLKQ